MKTAPTENGNLGLRALGQSIWLDSLTRHILVSGKLQWLIEHDGVAGVTFNTSAYEKALSGDESYATDIRQLAQGGNGADEICDRLVLQDVCDAADLLSGLYARTDGGEGFANLEVSSELAYDTEGMIEEASGLWREVKRPNVMIQLPATDEALPAIERLIADGVNVNVTNLLTLSRYRDVAESCLAGLWWRILRGLPVRYVASVASFPLCLLDARCDLVLDELIGSGDPKGKIASSLRGRIGVATGRMAYQKYKEVFTGDHFRPLAVKGARPQRLLWITDSNASYLDSLVGPATVSARPVETLEAYRHLPKPVARLQDNLAESREILSQFYQVRPDALTIAEELEEELVKEQVLHADHTRAALETRSRRGLTRGSRV
jgi:transaldolase